MFCNALSNEELVPFSILSLLAAKPSVIKKWQPWRTRVMCAAAQGPRLSVLCANSNEHHLSVPWHSWWFCTFHAACPGWQRPTFSGHPLGVFTLLSSGPAWFIDWGSFSKPKVSKGLSQGVSQLRTRSSNCISVILPSRFSTPPCYLNTGVDRINFSL